MSTENDSGFFALLGCPNGSGIVRMLTDYCDALGRRTVASVRVLLDSGDPPNPPSMYFVLADMATTIPAKRSKKSVAG